MEQSVRRLANVHTTATATMRESNQIARQIRSGPLEDPTLTLPAEKTKRRQQLFDEFVAKGRPFVEQLLGEVQDDVATITQFVAENRPTIGNDPGSIQRASILWDQAKTELAAGRPLRAVLAAASPDMVLAIAEWFPSWIALQHASIPALGVASSPPNFEPQLRFVEDRLIETHPGAFASGVLARREAEKIRDTATPLLNYARAQFDAGIDPSRAPNPVLAALTSVVGSQGPALPDETPAPGALTSVVGSQGPALPDETPAPASA